MVRTLRRRFFSSRVSSSVPTKTPSRPRFFLYTSSGACNLASLTAVGITSSMVMAATFGLTFSSGTTGLGVKLKFDKASKRPHSSANSPLISSCNAACAKGH